MKDPGNEVACTFSVDWANIQYGRSWKEVSGKKLKIFEKRLICSQGDIVNYFTNIESVFFFF